MVSPSNRLVFDDPVLTFEKGTSILQRPDLGLAIDLPPTEAVLDHPDRVMARRCAYPSNETRRRAGFAELEPLDINLEPLAFEFVSVLGHGRSPHLAHNHIGETGCTTDLAPVM